MKSLLRSLLITGALVLALALAYGALLAHPAPRISENATFSLAEPTEIEWVAVENAAGSYCFYYEDDGYVLDDIPGAIVDLEAFVDFMTGCGRLSAIRRVADDAVAEYGLDTPAADVEIRFFDGNALRLAIGAQERISGDYYVKAERFPGIHLMASTMAEPFLQPKEQMITKNVTPALAVTSPLAAIRDITFTGGALDKPVTIWATADGGEQRQLAALSFGSATHLVHGAGVHQLDHTYGVEMLGSLFGIRALDIAGYHLTDAEIGAMGFDSPWMTVEYDEINGANAAVERRMLKLARQSDDIFYAELDGSGAVFLIGRQPFMDIRYDMLPTRWFLTPMLMDLSAVTVEGEDRQYRFEIDNTDAKNPVVTFEGTNLDIRLFRSFFRLITSAAHDGVYLGALEKPEAGELLAVTYEYSAPGKNLDVLSLFRGGVRRANVFVNGVGEFAMKDGFVSRVLEGCENLLAGRPVEENW
ncbi:MAG: DUF4340 domain-containing protein [Clostridia bacterium]|nr:DUF4340 domain-containing protein [Clostridia bacterium]